MVELTVDRGLVDVNTPTAILTAEVGTRLADGYWLSIYDADANQRVALCDASAVPGRNVNTCDLPGYSRSVSVTVPTNGTKNYVAYVTKDVPPAVGPPVTAVRAASNVVSVSNSGWSGTVVLETASDEVDYLNPQTTLTATVSPALAGEYYLSIYDDDGHFVAGCDASPVPNTTTQACDVPRISRKYPVQVGLGQRRSFTAYVSLGPLQMEGTPTTDVRAVSGAVQVRNQPWSGTVSLEGTMVDGVPALVMTASPRLSFPYWIAVYDENGDWAAGCAAYVTGWGTTQPFQYCQPQASQSVSASALRRSGTYTPYVTDEVPPLKGPPADPVAVGAAVTPADLGPLLPGELDGGYNPSEDCGQPCHGDPVNSMTGEFFETNVDLSLDGPFEGFRLERDFSTARRAVNGPFGYGWSSNLDMTLTIAPGAVGTSLAGASQIVVRQENGSRAYFSRDEAGYSALPRVRATLAREADGSFVFARRATEFFRFSAAGRLERIEDRNGVGVDLLHDAGGRVVALKGDDGRAIDFTWSAGRIVAAADDSGRTVSYDYTASGALQSVKLADGAVVTYEYDAARRMTALGHRDGTTTVNTYDESSRVVSQTDPLGRTTAFAYGTDRTTVTNPLGIQLVERYSFGKLMAVTHAANSEVSATVAYTYGPQHNVETVTDPMGRTTRFTYDDNGNRLTVTDPLGRTTWMTYGAWNRLLTATNAAGETTRFTYDERGNLLAAADPNGAVATFIVNPNGTIASSADPTGYQTTYTYDNHGFASATTSPEGATLRTSFDSLGRLLSRTDPRAETPGASAADFTTTFTYDALGRSLTSTDALGAVVTHSYDAGGRPTVTTDSRGATTALAYDAAGQLTSVTDALGQTTSYTYDAAGRPLTVTDASGATTRSSYDDLGRLVAVTDPLGRVAKTEYDLAGRITASVAPSGARTTYTYDAAGQLLTVTDPLGGVTTTTYDAAGRPITVTDADGRAVTTCYDGAGRPVKVTRADGSTLTWTYDAAGRVLTSTDAAGNATRYTYDAVGRRATTTDVAGRVTSYAYGPSGLLDVVTLADGGTITYTYDAVGRRTGIDYSDGTPDVAYEYDIAGRVTSMTDGTGTTSYTYDAVGHLLTVTTPRGEVGYGWDDLGRLAQLTYPSGEAVARTYDAAGQLATVTDWADREFAFDWTEDGQLDAVTYPNGVVTSRERDAAGRVTGLTAASSAGLELLDIAYGYSDAGLVTERTVTRGTDAVASSYAWDALSRVDAVTGEGAGDAAFDAAGSVTALPDGRTLTYDDGRQLTSMTAPALGGSAAVTTAFAYDGRGNRVTATSDAGTVTNAFDLANRLTSVTDPDGEVSAYTYDGDGLRTSAGSGGATESFTWDVGAGYPLLLADGEHAYVYGVAGVPLEQVSLDDGAVDFLHPDTLGSVIATTDDAGEVTSRADYDLYGESTAVGAWAAVSSVTRFGYAGEYTDPTGYIYLRARYYDPATAQFLSVDPLVDTTGNPYGYTSGNPMQFADPRGLDEIEDLGNWFAGFGDTVTFGGTQWVREQLGVNGVVDTCSDFYTWGSRGGMAAQVGLAFASGGLSVAYDAVGAGVSANDAATAIANGDYTAAAIAAAGALPGVPGGFRGAGDAVSAATRAEHFVADAANTGSAWTRVGRWMSPTERAAMEEAGSIQWNTSGVHRVANPASPTTYRGAPRGDIYVEYDVPSSVLRPHSEGTSIIYGPESLQARLPGRAQPGDVPFRNLVEPR